MSMGCLWDVYGLYIYKCMNHHLYDVYGLWMFIYIYDVESQSLWPFFEEIPQEDMNPAGSPVDCSPGGWLPRAWAPAPEAC